MQFIPIDAKTFTFELFLTRGNNWPIWTINQPYKILNETTSLDEKTIVIKVDIREEELIITNQGKLISDTVLDGNDIIRNQSLCIRKMWANDILLELDEIKNVTEFIPVYDSWNITHAEKNNIVLPISIIDLNFYYNGSWHLKFKQPFFIWYNDLIINGLNKYNQWVKESHFGFGDQEHLDKLKLILSKLSK